MIWSFATSSLCAKEGNGWLQLPAGECLRKDTLGKSGRDFLQTALRGLSPQHRRITFVTRFTCGVSQRPAADSSINAEKLFQEGASTPLRIFTN